MASITLGGDKVHTSSELPKVGEAVPNFELITSDLKSKTLDDFEGNRLIFNIFPSIDTNTCATSVREFNKKASSLDNTKVLCISRDLPFAHKRFCAAEGIENVVALSDFRDGTFGKVYGLNFIDGAFKGLHSRAVVVTDKDHNVIYTQQVEETADEPDYEAALNALS